MLKWLLPKTTKQVRSGRIEPITEEEIGKKAYELWLSTGNHNSEDNWYKAKRLLEQKTTKKQDKKLRIKEWWKTMNSYEKLTLLVETLGFIVVTL